MLTSLRSVFVIFVVSWMTSPIGDSSAWAEDGITPELTRTLLERIDGLWTSIQRLRGEVQQSNSAIDALEAQLKEVESNKPQPGHREPATEAPLTVEEGEFESDKDYEATKAKLLREHMERRRLEEEHQDAADQEDYHRALKQWLEQQPSRDIQKKQLSEQLSQIRGEVTAKELILKQHLVALQAPIPCLLDGTSVPLATYDRLSHCFRLSVQFRPISEQKEVSSGITKAVADLQPIQFAIQIDDLLEAKTFKNAYTQGKIAIIVYYQVTDVTLESPIVIRPAWTEYKTSESFNALEVGAALFGALAHVWGPST